MKNTVAIRKMEIYQTDDARRIEVWNNVGKTSFAPMVKGNIEDFSEPETEEESLFIGVLQVVLPEIGPKEIRFKIEATAIEQAFENYNELAEQTATEVEKKFQEYVQQRDNQIITAPAGMAEVLKDAEGQAGDGGLIIL